MGLFGTLLQPFFVDCVGYLARPSDFVREPLSWLRGISRYAVTTSGAPTFAYASCARDSGSIDGLDLSSWDVAFVGAEPVRTALLRLFCDRFGMVGFDPKALMPCYGLAEAVLFVTGERRGVGLQTIRDAGGLVRGLNLVTSDIVCVGSIGKPGTTQVRLRRAGALRAVQPGDHVGEILVAGPSVTRAAGVARADEGWVATGDLGLLRDGRLYVCARLKDVVKVRGRSVSLAEIDQCVGATLADPSISVCSFESPEPGRSCSVWVALQSNRALIACDELLRRRIEADVLAQLGVVIRVRGLPPRPRRIVRTASGKLNRIATRDACMLDSTAVV
jgi:acyl-CoA synthetase (AMP-forming)/AMP-acid ligase II